MFRENNRLAEIQKEIKKETKLTERLGRQEIEPIIENLNKHCRFCYEGHLKEVKRKRILKLLLDRLNKLKKLGITIEELMENNPFPTQAFQREESKNFLDYARKGEKFRMRALLKICRYYVYEYDHVKVVHKLKQTALHWAAKRGHLENVEILIEYGADINAKDSMEKTPMYYAYMGNHFQIVWVAGSYKDTDQGRRSRLGVGKFQHPP